MKKIHDILSRLSCLNNLYNRSSYSIRFSNDCLISKHSIKNLLLLIIPLVFSVQALSQRNCIDFTTYPTNYCDTFYLDNNPSNALYTGCINNGFEGIYPGVGNVNLNFNGSNQEITITGYGDPNQFDQMGYSINGGPVFYLDGSFPMTVGSVTIDMYMTGQSQDGFEYYEITFTGNISTIMHESFESGITSICSENIWELSVQENTKKEPQLKIYPNPSTDRVTIEGNEKFEKIDIFSIKGQLIQTVVPNAKKVTLNIEQFDAGIYFIKAYIDTEIINERLIKE